jgi:hypothetical protein
MAQTNLEDIESQWTKHKLQRIVDEVAEEIGPDFKRLEAQIVQLGYKIAPPEGTHPKEWLKTLFNLASIKDAQDKIEAKRLWQEKIAQQAMQQGKIAQHLNLVAAWDLEDPSLDQSQDWSSLKPAEKPSIPEPEKPHGRRFMRLKKKA